MSAPRVAGAVRGVLGASRRQRGSQLAAAVPVSRKAEINGDSRRRSPAARLGGIGVPPAALAAGPGPRLAGRAGVPQPQPAGGLRGRLPYLRRRAGKGRAGHPVRRRPVLRVGGARFPAGADLPLHPGEPGRLQAVRAARRGREVPAVLPGRGQGQDHLGAAHLRERGHDHAERHRQAVQGGVPRPGAAERHRQGRVLRRPGRGGPGPGHRHEPGAQVPGQHRPGGGAADRRAAAVHHGHVADRDAEHPVRRRGRDQVLACLLRQRGRPAGHLRQPRRLDDAAVQGVARRRGPPGVHQQGLRRAGGVPRLPHRQGARRRRGGRQEPAGGDRRADRGADPARAGGRAGRPAAGRAGLRAGLLQPDRRLRQAPQHGAGGRHGASTRRPCGARSDARAQHRRPPRCAPVGLGPGRPGREGRAYDRRGSP